MSESHANRMLEALKGVLKSKGLTYRDLAARCDLTEVTIKRLLNRPHIGLDQLIQLCDAVGTPMSELVLLAESRIDTAMSEEQLAGHLEKPALFEVFASVLAGKRTIDSLTDSFSINRPSAYLYARELEKLNFITLSGDNIELVYPLATTFSYEDAPELSALYRDAFMQVFNQKLDVSGNRNGQENEDTFHFGLRLFTESELKRYKESLNAVHEEFGKIGLNHIRNPQENVNLYRAVFGLFEADAPLFPVKNLVDKV
ncbi:hypothetical protein CS022_08065 [Veronia nyctiphanis]|uniref:HTH cro/C1-type domain-containing protein n=1 Tax=Veronia nyctiphanis TaxID=1278244 RepID=A0A4Q0YRF1_9GAMM|nr:helix-turn-helix transcriptional regulator [Veronia nyctiphanis]RXJ73686.1 hypothetical protein CS022_08065 [Veronia nyctiphanis]